MSGQAGWLTHTGGDGRAARGRQAPALHRPATGLGRTGRTGLTGLMSLLGLMGWIGLISGVPAVVWAQRAPPELTACVAANRQAATDLLQARDSEIRRHALHAVLVSRLQGLGGSFSQLKAAAARNPRNLAECEKTTETLTAGREQLERMVGTPEQQAECSAANQAGYGEMQAALLALQSSGKASVPALEAASSRLALLRPALNRDGQTLADCRQLASEVQAEKVQVQRLLPAAPPPAPVAPVGAAVAAMPSAATAAAATVCRAAQMREYNEVAQAYAQFIEGGTIAQELMAPLQSLSARLTSLSVSIATAGAPGWECEGINRALAQARSELGKLRR